MCGGPLIEQGIHFQDVLRYITDDEPVSVYGTGELGKTEPVKGRDCEETTVLATRHESGMLTTHIQNWCHKGTLVQIQIVGLDFDLTWNTEDGLIVGRDGDQAIEERLPADAHLEEMRGFVRAVAEKDQAVLRSDYLDACRTLALCEAARKAVETGVPQPIEPLGSDWAK